ncbi:unnamed protein product [Larinioides sclopetarius]|uniref:Uncharacterized protein n=1 Tax=Larinioides sclopetarius TaxID=280406 RepID=A0AAV1Z1D7_9ARAC
MVELQIYNILEDSWFWTRVALYARVYRQTAENGISSFNNIQINDSYLLR